MKFRVYNFIEEVMYYPEYNSPNRSRYSLLMNGTLIEHGFSEEDSGIHEYMLSTGLIDKNGKEIFEGDIINHKYGLGMDVKFKDGMFKCRTRTKEYTPLHYLSGCNPEVIGNIYENPELLK